MLWRPGDGLVKVSEDEGPGLEVLLGRGRVVEPGVGQSQAGAGAIGGEFHTDDGLRSVGPVLTRHPGEFEEPIEVEGEKPPVVGVAAP